MFNYNSILEDLLIQSSASTLEEAIANQFSPAVIREKLRVTRKYERLPLLLPFFKLSTNDNVYVELAADLLTEICSEQSTKRKSVLEACFADMNNRCRFCHSKTAFRCGKMALPLTCLSYLYNEEYVDKKEKQYVGGVLATDNLDCFLQLPLEMQLLNKDEIYWNARKIMDHFMSDKVRCSRYCEDSLEHKDIEDIRFLLAYPNTRPHLVRHLCETRLYGEQYQFISSILSEGLLVLTEAEYERMKRGNKILYDYLSVDV